MKDAVSAADRNRLEDFRKLSTLVAQLVPEAGDRPIGGVTQAELERRWPSCAGRAADQSFPLMFRSGRLVIFTQSAIWATELRHLRRGIEIALNDLGMTAMEVKAIPKLMPQRRIVSRSVTLSKNAGQNIEAAAEGLSDPDLRAVVKRLGGRGSNGPKSNTGPSGPKSD